MFASYNMPRIGKLETVHVVNTQAASATTVRQLGGGGDWEGIRMQRLVSCDLFVCYCMYVYNIKKKS